MHGWDARMGAQMNKEAVVRASLNIITLLWSNLRLSSYTHNFWHLCVFELMRQYEASRYVFPIRIILKAIWCAWLLSCGVSRGGIIRINMAGGFPSALGCSRIFLKVLGKSSCGWRIFYYRVLLSHLLIIFLLPQVGRLPCFWHNLFSQLLREHPTHVLSFFQLFFRSCCIKGWPFWVMVSPYEHIF